MDNSHIFELDLNKSLNNQNLLYATKCILVNLFEEYIELEEDKKNRKIKEDNEKRKKYNPDNIFEKTKIQIERIEIDKEDKELIVIEESFLKKLLNKIRNLLKRK